MKRDRAVLRIVLEACESITYGSSLSFGQIFPHLMKDGQYVRSEESTSVRFHLDLLSESGYVKRNFDKERPIYSGLTWSGHDLLDNLR
ncbi:DUF2513 domain-containing protein [Pseudomonas sp. MCal1]|uniref:DUF2513 domain-containing protein n=1 Tax=Pseudomonas sp. MCal1 TaxID=2919887 RepID=UPI003A7F3A27